MKWALQSDIRIEAEPKIDNAICPLCKEKVIPKCGRIVTWHWAHKSLQDCDVWYEPESQWHLDWKNKFPKECQEVIIKKEEKFHIADIKVNEKVIELQNSSISPNEIKEREKFYGNMIWILNGDKFARNLSLRYKGNYFSFRWKHPPKSWWDSNKLIYIDLSPLVDLYKIQIKRYKQRMNSFKEHEYYSIDFDYEIKTLKDKIEICKNNLFLIKKIHTQCPCGGWGILICKNKFIEENNG